MCIATCINRIRMCSMNTVHVLRTIRATLKDAINVVATMFLTATAVERLKHYTLVLGLAYNNNIFQ